MAGIRFRDGRIIDFLNSPWEIEVDDANDEVIFRQTVEGYEFTFDGNGNFNVPGTAQFSGQDLEALSLIFSDYLQNTSGAYYEGVETLASVNGNHTVDISNSNQFYYTVDGDVTFSFTGASNNVDGAAFTLLIEMSGANAITWPASVTWDNLQRPIDPSDTEMLEYTFVTYDGGATWHGRTSWGTE